LLKLKINGVGLVEDTVNVVTIILYKIKTKLLVVVLREMDLEI